MSNEKPLTSKEAVRATADVMKDDSPTTVVFPQVEAQEQVKRDALQIAISENVPDADNTRQMDYDLRDERLAEQEAIEEEDDDSPTLSELLFPRGWDQEFTSRQWGLIKNCRTYAENEPSGLPGHQLMLIVAIMADQFDAVLAISNKLSEDLAGNFAENRIYSERLEKIDADRRDDLKLIAELEVRNQRLRMELETLHGNHLKDMGRVEELEGQLAEKDNAVGRFRGLSETQGVIIKEYAGHVADLEDEIERSKKALAHALDVGIDATERIEELRRKLDEAYERNQGEDL